MDVLSNVMLHVLSFSKNSKMTAMTSSLPIFKSGSNCLKFLQTDLLVCILILCCSHIDRKSNITMTAAISPSRAPGYLWELSF